MAVIKSMLMETGSTFTIEDFKRTYRHEFLVESNNQNDLQITIYQGSMGVGPFPVPADQSTYNINGNVDTGVFLTSKEVSRHVDEQGTNRLFWKVTCTWTVPPAGQGTTPNVQNPLQRPVRYALEWSNYTRILEKDKDGNPIVNSAGDRFEAIEQDDARPVLVAMKNEWPLESIIAKAIQYKNAVNSDTFYGATARRAKIESIVSGQLLAENNIQFYTVTYRIQFNDEQWDLKLVDRGKQVYHYTDFEGTKVKVWPRVQVGEHAGEYLESVNLNPDGTQREDALPALFKEPAYRIYPELPFDGLGI